MGIFNKVFGGGADKETPPRLLDHPRKLNVGDMVRFKQYAPRLLQEDMFRVEEVNTCHYKSGKEFEFVLRGTSQYTLFLTVEESDDGPRMRLSVKLPRDIWEELFEEGHLSSVIDEEQGQVIVRRRVDPDTSTGALSFLAGWTAPEYIRESFAIRGYYHKGDYRNKTIPDDADDSEELDYYGLESKDEKFALEVEVYDEDTDVLVTLITDVSLIDEMWPGS